MANIGRLSAWTVVAVAALLFILVPYFIYEADINQWFKQFLDSRPSRWSAGGVVGALLAADVALPVPSSLVSTASGVMLGFWVGALASWSGMTLGCVGGYALGRWAGREAAARIVGKAELEKVSRGATRFGHWVIILFRPVPVLAEASVIFAGMARLPWRRFLALVALSNLGISMAYAAVGAFAVRVESFLLALAGAIVLPWLAMLAVRQLRGQPDDQR